MLFLSIGDDIKFGVLDILRNIGMSLINMLFDTIDVLYNVAHSINSMNFIQLLAKIENSPFTKIFNAFFILAFIVLFLFSVWKITFKILDADNNEQPMFEIVKEIVKCGFLIISIYMLFNITIDIGINLSNAIYNNFNVKDSTIGDKMKTSYLSINEKCYKIDGGESVDEDNVKELKELLEDYSKVDSAKTMEDFEKLIRGGKLTVSQVTDSDSLSFRCQIYEKGIWNDGEDYAFNYNFLFGIVIGVIFLFAIGFSVLMLGKRQLELAFLMVISPLVIASSVGRKEQRSSLYQQLASLILQAGALMLLIGLTSIMFNAIQNSPEINAMDGFTKLVAQTVLYLGCAIMLMTGCNSLTRFIGDNVSGNTGRDMMIALHGLSGSAKSAGHLLLGGAGVGVASGVGAYKVGKGLGQFVQGASKVPKGLYRGVASIYPKANSGIASKMQKAKSKGEATLARAKEYQSSSNPFARSYGRMLESRGEANMEKIANQWDFEKGKYNPEYFKNGLDTAREGINNIKSGFGGIVGSFRYLANPNAQRYRSRPNIKNYDKDRL